MYRILTNGTLFCSSKIEELSIINPVIELEVNKAGTFTFTVPPNHPYYANLADKDTLIDVYRDDDTEPIFEGIVATTEVDFFKQKKVTCEGELTFLNDSILRPNYRQGYTSRQLLESYINEHNSLVEAKKRFTVGQVTAKDTNDYITCYTNYQSTMTEIKEDLIDDIGGYLRTRHVSGTRYLDYLAESPRTNNQIIRLGENLIDLSIGLENDDLATVIIPLGTTLETQTIQGLDERLTIKTAPADEQHPSGADYVFSQSAVDTFGWIEKVVTWDNVTTVNNLLSKGKKYLQETQFENLVIQVKAVDLGLTTSDFQKFKPLDLVRVISEPHGLDRYFMLTKMTINLNNPEQDTITLGKSEANSLSAKTASANSQIMDRIEQLPTSNAVKAAIDNATALITGAEGGYVVYSFNESGQPIEIKIQDALNNPTKIWRWNQNGFGYSNDGGQTYGLAMTMDGAIVANYITSGTMVADRVRGGTFEVGGTSLGKDGKILVKNSSGTTLITIDKNGIAFSGGEQIPYSAISGTPSIPTKTSDLTNDSGWVTSSQATTITKNTVTTAYVNALNVTARYIVADLIQAGCTKIGKMTITQTYIAGINDDNTRRVALRAFDNDYGDDTAALQVEIRGSTSEQWTNRMFIRYNGDTWIGGGADLWVEDINKATGNQVTVNAELICWGNVITYGDFLDWSDRRVKKDIQPLSEKYLKAFYALSPTEFRMDENIFVKDDGKLHLGFIAQDVEKAFNDSYIDLNQYALLQENDIELNHRDRQPGEEKPEKETVKRLSLSYNEFTALITLAVQEQKKEIDLLREEIDELKEEIKLLKGEN